MELFTFGIAVAVISGAFAFLVGVYVGEKLVRDNAENAQKISEIQRVVESYRLPEKGAKNVSHTGYNPGQLYFEHELSLMLRKLGITRERNKDV
jgi:hypothetical protein